MAEPLAGERPTMQREQQRAVLDAIQRYVFVQRCDHDAGGGMTRFDAFVFVGPNAVTPPALVTS
ncbi:hypothetical protein DEA06_03440 [Microbacterium sp. Gd 4-13]|uniref:hypothetical protein n=1 Tax=Microbacterium sp. Gd 4-13 TaxID=2173179 RepID=UPI000D56E825|nr:hypothetical protein [Microbacterium sp. Gd 4-13]PVW06573.1 hypothetical protein DEA06_03440 [Microbacterium sp. Gd 4-13]